MTDNSFLRVALDAVAEAEIIINKYYSDNIRSTLKADQSPVTIADQEAEQVIRKIIQSHFPKHSILGEEQGKNLQESEFLWIIDPIDGTKNYMRKVPLFATQLALMKAGEVIIGVSNAPAMHELMHAEKGKGTYLNGKKMSVSSIHKIDEAYLSYGGIGYFDKNNLLQSLIKIEQDTRAHRGIGDFWSYHLLAQGKIDIMLEAETKLWDIAAVSLIVEEAGGKVTDLKGNSVNEKTTSVIASNDLIHDAVSSYFE